MKPIHKAQRANALRYAKEAEAHVFALFAYLDDLNLDSQADEVDDVLHRLRSVTKFLHDLECVDPTLVIK